MKLSDDQNTVVTDDGCQIPCLTEERKDNRDVYFIVLN